MVNTTGFLTPMSNDQLFETIISYFEHPSGFLVFVIVSIKKTITISITITKTKNLVVPSKQELSSSKSCRKQVVKKIKDYFIGALLLVPTQ